MFHSFPQMTNGAKLSATSPTSVIMNNFVLRLVRIIPLHVVDNHDGNDS